MNKVKILEVIGSMNLGGAETFLMNVLRNINKEKFELYFLCYSDEKFDYQDEIEKLGGHIIRVEKVNKRNLFNYVKILKNIIIENDINVVHSHTAYNSMFPLIAAKKCGIKNRITHSHNTTFVLNPSLIKRIYVSMSKFIIKKYSTIKIACGVDAGKALFGKNSDFIVLDNGIILENYFYNHDFKETKRKELNIENDDYVICHIGRFDEQKNHTFLIDIFKTYIDNYDKKAKLLLIGDGILRSNIEEKVNNLKLNKNVMFLGKRHDVNQLYSASDLLLFPSKYEGLPVTLIEAQANGIPILASDTIDNEVNITNKIIFLPLTNSLKDWARTMQELKNKRYNCNELMNYSVYNMKTNVKKIEEIYGRKF